MKCQRLPGAPSCGLPLPPHAPSPRCGHQAVDLSALESSRIWEQITDCNSPISWAVCGYADAKTVVVQARSDRGLAVLACLPPLPCAEDG
jgi:hypothetical protein